MRIWRPITIVGLLLTLTAGCSAAPVGPAPAPSGTGSTAVPGASTPAPSTAPSPSPAGSASTDAGTGGSGIAGQITIDGGCPVVTDRGCPDRPYLARLTVSRSPAGPVVATLLTRTDGTYRVALPPGGYLLRVANPQDSPYPMARSVPVTVPADGYVTENVRLDSGIR